MIIHPLTRSERRQVRWSGLLLTGAALSVLMLLSALSMAG